MAMGQNPRTLTAANSVVLFKADGFFDQAIQLQGFQVDNAFTFGDATIGESRIGVDGKQSGGWVSHEVPVTVFLEGNSASRASMEEFYAWMNAHMETARCTLDVTIPSIGRRIVATGFPIRSEEHTSELQSRPHLVCRLLLEKKNKTMLNLRICAPTLRPTVYELRVPP